MLAVFDALAQPLPELARAALFNDPSITAAASVSRAAAQRVYQAQAAFGPTAGLTANYSQTRYGDQSSAGPRSLTGKQLGLQVSQPLYRLPLFSSLSSAQAQAAQAEAAVEQAQSESMHRLVEAYFDVMRARDEVALARAQQVSTSEQLASAKRSFKIGTAAITDVREAEAKADTVSAQLTASQFNAELKQQELAELVGMPVTGIESRGLTGERMPPVVAHELTDWLLQGFASNAQLRQARLGLEAAQAEVAKAQQGHAPSAELTYNKTRNSDTGSVTNLEPRRYGSGQIGISITIPLFASGATQSKVAEALAMQDKAQSDVEAAQRAINLAVRQSFSAVLSAATQAAGMETAVRSAEASLKANRRGYEVGMKVNAEVLDAQSRLFESRRDLSKARYDAWVSFVKLKAAAGTLQETDLAMLDGLLATVDAAMPEGPTHRRGTP